MSLVLAAVEETLGPVWAQMINDALALIDLHDHTEGNGVKINQAAVELTGDFNLLGYALLNAIALTLSNAGVAADTDLIGSIQRVGQNLYYVNTAGVPVQITNGNAVVSSGSGAMTLAGPVSFPYTVLTSDAQKVLVADTSPGAKSFVLPSAINSMYFVVKDSGGRASINNISVIPDGTDAIDGVNATFVCDYDYGSWGFISDGVSKWYVV